MTRKFESITRRDFLSITGKISTGILASGVLASCQKNRAFVTTAKVFGANDRINVGVVGVRSRGWALAENIMEIENVHLKAICDVDGNVLDKRFAEFEKKHGYKLDTYQDMRKLLDDPAIDAVAFATPNHWHALCAIWACQAGKHVYVRSEEHTSELQSR